MNYKSKYKPELCVSKDPSRQTIIHAKLEGNYLISTDGRRLSAIPVERSDIDTDGYIPAKVLKAAPYKREKVYMGRRKYETQSGPKIITAKKRVIRYSEKEYMIRPQEGATPLEKFPAYKTVFPKKGSKIKFQIALNPKLLYELACAIGEPNAVCITVMDSDEKYQHSPLVVRPIGNSESIGVLMPMRGIDDTIALDHPLLPE